MSNKTIDRVAFFSSLGPTFDQRIKPDILAPGYFTFSASAGDGVNKTCQIMRSAGTSMSTPAVAGIAALIRQYFEDSSNGASSYQRVCQSIYPLCAEAFSPRGATVKAIIIHSGQAMKEYYTGKFNTTEPSAPLLNAPPDYYQGYGRLSLTNVLPFPTFKNKLDLYVEELEVESLQEIIYDVVVTDSSYPLKVTIVWMDPVNHIIQSKLLLHDIDLQVIDENDVVHYGNNQPSDEVLFISSLI
jgi:subtilisin family serine protease